MEKRTRKLLSFTLAGFALPAIASAIIISTINYKMTGPERLIAHRGWSAKYFQNTYAAFNGAVGGTESKFWGAEVDLQMDSENKIWCSHYINPFEDVTKKIDELTTVGIQNEYLKTDGALNPYKINVPRDSFNDQLCPFYDPSNNVGYLNCFLNNNAHPIIELKIESVLQDDPIDDCMKIDQDKVTTFITNILKDIQTASTSDASLLSRCYFVSFSDDLLAETIRQVHEDTYSQVSNKQFQKLLDDGGNGAYILSDTYKNTTPGSKTGSTTNVKNYEKYVDGSWNQDGNEPIGIDVYYGLLTSKMINKAHQNNVEANCWTANYTRTEIAEAMSLNILAKSGCDLITTDDWFNLK